MHTMDLSNISLNRMGERTVSDKQEADSMSVMKDHDSRENEGQDRSHDLVRQFYEGRIFNKESEPKIILAKYAEERKLMAAREDRSQQEHVACTISQVEPDYKEAQPILGWMKASSVTPRLELFATETIYLFNVNAIQDTKQQAPSPWIY
jgi:hypothetical protein